jgi:hypothetical protein
MQFKSFDLKLFESTGIRDLPEPRFSQGGV